MKFRSENSLSLAMPKKNMTTVFLSMLLIGYIIDAKAYIVDDFTDDTVNPAWIQVLLLSRDSGTVTYDTTTNDNELTITSGHSDAEQIGWLRDDYSLLEGDCLSVDLISMTDVSSGGDFTAGLMIATGTDIGIGEYVGTYPANGTQQDRRDYVTITYDSRGDRILSEFFDGDNSDQSGSSQSLSTVIGFWIERTGPDSFDVGWIDTSNQPHTLRSVTFTSGNTPGAAVGFYTDMRHAGGFAVFDNLAIDGDSILITSQPTDITVVDGNDVTFTIIAEDLLGGTLSYQWYDEAGMLENGDYGGRISGADSNSLTITDVTDSDEGIFYCELTNSSMTISTDSAVLTVVPYFCDESFPSHLDIAGGPDGTGDCMIDLLDLTAFLSEWLSI